MALSENTENKIKSKKVRGLLQSSGLVGIMTLLSRVFGLARDVVVVHLFGASASADAFFIAF